MGFCTNCGRKLVDGAKFCYECGTSTNAANDQQSTRKITYEGELRKCPNCRELINAFVPVCPSCGYEVRGSSSTSIVHKLSLKLDKEVSIDKKEELIRNFYVPNTREDIIECLILASSNIETNSDCRNAWAAKLEQIYQKAKLTFGSSAKFEYVDRLYRKSKKTLSTKRVISATGGVGKSLVSVLSAIGRFFKTIILKFFDLLKNEGFRLVFLIILCFTILLGMVVSGKYAYNKHIEHLETLVVEVEELIEEGDYDAARIKAAQIVDDTDWSSDSEKKWNNIRKTLIKAIDEAEKESKKK